MAWTHKPPTKPGYYWAILRLDDPPSVARTIVEVTQDTPRGMPVVWFIGIEIEERLDVIDWWWDQPITKPRLPRRRRS